MSATVALAFGLAWLLSLGLTPLVRAWANRRGMVCHPRADRWSQRPVALLGGIAIAGAVSLAALPFLSQFGFHEQALLAVSLSQFLLGLLDDRLHIKPHTKLIGQLIAAVLLVDLGFRFGFEGPVGRLIDPFWTVLWLVGIANAFNLLDNMDGLSAGIAVIAAIFLTILHLDGRAGTGPALLSAVLAGACLGYLKYNQHPASIFMGDCGSLFIGFYLAGAVLLSGGGAGRSLLGVLALPAMLMLTPMMDTILVTLTRKLARRQISQGGTDHTSHRLVALGLSESKAVRLLYLLSFSGGLVALAVRYLDWYVSSLLLPIVLLAVGALGWHLGGVRVYHDDEERDGLLDGTPVPLLAQHRYRRRVGEVLVDTLSISVAFYIACALRFEGSLALPEQLNRLKLALPVVLVAHLIAYHIAGVYRGIWRYTSVSDLPRFGRAVILGLLLTIALLVGFQRWAGLSRSLLLINALVQLGFLAGTRVSLKLFRDRLQAAAEGGEERVLVIGMGEQAELSLRLLRTDRSLTLVGAICEEISMVGRQLLDVPVLGTSREIEATLEQTQAERIVLVDPAYDPDCWRRIQLAAERGGILAQVVRHTVETVEVRGARPGER